MAAERAQEIPGKRLIITHFNVFNQAINAISINRMREYQLPVQICEITREERIRANHLSILQGIHS